jgi:hypothetical protein
MAPINDPWIIQDSSTIEKEYGWIFFYSTERFVKTGNYLYALAGNGPIIVNKNAASVDVFRSIPPLPTLIAEYERKLEKPR